MEEIILTFIPSLINYPIFLILVELITFIFFGGFIFSSLWNLITGYTIGKYKR